MRRAALVALTVLLAACGRGADDVTLDIPPAEARPASLGPSIKWAPESPRYQQIRRAAFKEGRDFRSRVDLAAEKLSRKGLYRVQVVERSPAEVGEFQQWRLRVSTADGKPVRDAVLSVSGGMPEHGHALSSQPEVIPGATAGEYLVRGVQFNMPGWWELSCYITDRKQDDSVTFNIIAS